MKASGFLRKKKLLTAGAVALAAVVCILVQLLPFRMVHPNCSGSRTYSVSDASKRFLSSVSEDVEIVYYSKGGEKNADQDLYSFVLALAAQSSHLRVTLEDPAQTGAEVNDQSILVRSAKRERSLSIAELFYYYNLSYNVPMTIEEYAAVIKQMQSITDAQTYQSYLSVYGPAQMQVRSTLDRSLISAVRYVLAERAPTLGVYSNVSGSINALLQAQLEQSGYDVRAMKDLDGIPSDCEALYLELGRDLTEAEGNALRGYLENGGKLFLTTAYTMEKATVLASVLEGYGLSSPDVMNLLYGSGQATQFYAVAGDHPITDTIGDTFFVSNAHLIETTPVEGVIQSVLLRTPDGSYSVRADLKDGEAPASGSFSLGVLAERGDSAVLWVSTLQDSMVNGISGGANFAFVQNALNDFTAFSVSAMNVADAALPSTYLAVTPSVVGVWILVFVVALPSAMLVIGGIRCYVRKKRGE